MESLYFPEKKINWHGFQIAKVHFSYSIWLMIFEKSIMLCSMVYTFLLMVHAYTKSVSKQGIQKNYLQEFPILLALNYYTFICTCDFYWYEHIILRKEGISKHSGKQENFAIGLDSCYLFNLEHGTEHEIDRAYGVCMHLTFLNFTTDEFDSLVVCNIITFFFNSLWEGKFFT